jgi:hypothetical protein
MFIRGEGSGPVGDVDRFANEGNISLFANHLRYETNPARQEKLKRLLIEEERRLGLLDDCEGLPPPHTAGREPDLQGRLLMIDRPPCCRQNRPQKPVGNVA